MALRQLLRTVLKKTISTTIGAGLIFAQCDDNKLTENDEKMVKLEISKFEKLSFDYLIKNSVIDAVNSTSQTLTIAYVAIETTSKEYRELLGQLMGLMEDMLIYEVSDEHQDKIIATRVEVQSKKKVLSQLISHMDYVERMVEAVSMVTHSAGMENLAMTLCERMDDANKHKDKEVSHNRRLEKEYDDIEQRCVKKSSDN